MNESNVLETETKTVKKGVSPIVVFLLGILFGAIFGLGGWYLGTKYAESEDKKENTKVEETNKKDESEHVEVVKLDKNQKYTFAKEHKTLLSVNGKDLSVTAYYYVDYEKEELGPYTYDESDLKDVYVTRMDLYVEAIKVVDAAVMDLSYEKADSDTFINTTPAYDTKVFKDSSNTDEYTLLGLDNYGSSKNLDYKTKNFLLINDEGKLLKSFIGKSFSGVVGVYGPKEMIGDRNSRKSTIKDGWFDLYSDGLVDIHDNYIYELQVQDSCDSVNEFRYTISNGEIVSSKTVTYTYENILGAGQC